MRIYRKLPRKHRPHGREITYLKWFSNIRVGDLVHDCDGFNHIVSKVKFMRLSFRSGWCVSLFNSDIICDDGYLPCHPSAPESVDHINSYWSSGPDNHPLSKRAKTGVPICDEKGRVLPEFSKMTDAYTQE